ncbi:MAG TPA: pitrilysin family protein, partial [Verrucomicrobiae bacterium]|nr:pitrilysin family protein [Verrucomicrobiae bacterium]
MDKQIIGNDWLGEKVYHGILPAGLNVFVMPKPGFSKQYATFSTHYGSIDNHFKPPGTDRDIKVPDGIAHFLEHKLFEEEFGNIFDEFAKLGANTNAFTSWTTTSYLFSSTEYFHENLELLLDFVQRPYFTAENVEKEKGIIEQEIRMYQDNAHWRGFFNLLGAMFHNHPVKIDIAGTAGSIREITPETLMQCYKTFYHPANMALFVTGDLDPDRVLAQVEENLAGRNYVPQAEIERIFPPEPQGIKTRSVETALAVSRPTIFLGFKDQGAGSAGEELLTKEISTEILLEAVFGRGSELYNKLYEAGLTDENFSAEYLVHSSYGATVIGGESKDPEALTAEIEKAVTELRQKGLDRSSLERSRKKQLGRFIRGFNSLEFVANNFLNYHFLGT